MFAFGVVGIFILIIAIIIYVEYKNEKVYQEERKRKAEERKNKKIQKPQETETEKEPKKRTATQGLRRSVPPLEKRENRPVRNKDNDTKPPEEKKEVNRNIAPTEKKKEKIYDLPKCKYPAFNYSRLIDMGLSEEEAIEFTRELIPQIKTQIPLIKEAMEKKDLHSMERLTHSIKGSSTTVGTGGISDLLVEYNTYLKTGKDMPIVEAYFKQLERYAEALEKQFA